MSSTYDDPEDNYRPRPFEEGAVPGWYAMTPDGAVADERRFAYWKGINRAIELGRLGLRHEQGTLSARYLSPEGWLDDDQSMRRRKIEERLDKGEFTLNYKGEIVCAFCGGNCGQCGNTGLTDVNGPSMDAMIHGLYPDPIGKLKQEIVKAVISHPWDFVLKLCFSMGVVVFMIVWYMYSFITCATSASFNRGHHLSAYEAGYSAYYAGKAITSNPYSKGSQPYDDWEAGWEDGEDDDVC